MTPRTRPFWTWMVAVLIGVPALYVLSFGPACWLAVRTETDHGRFFAGGWLGSSAALPPAEWRIGSL